MTLLKAGELELDDLMVPSRPGHAMTLIVPKLRCQEDGSTWMGSQVGKKIVELREFVGLEADCKCSSAGVSFETCPICQRCKVMHSYQVGRGHQTGARSWYVQAGLPCRETGGMGQKHCSEEMYTRILGFLFFFL